MSIPYAAAVTFNQDTENLLYVMKVLKMKQKGSAQSKSDLPSHLTRAAGILKYMRESTDHRLTIVPQSQVLMDYQIKCEYCGQQASPSLDLICMHEVHSETALTFCCDQWEQLYELLLKLRYLLEGQSEDLKIATQGDTRKQSKDLVYRTSIEKVSKYTDSPKVNKPEERLFKDYLIEVPVQETTAPGSKTMSFHLSCPPEGSWAKLPENLTEKMATFDDKALKTDMEVPFSVPFCDHLPLDFGLCHHQDVGDFVNKYYLEGTRFLTVFDNGSAQVFYPSGLLAIIVAVTKEHGRVCIVYDDTPCQAIRALFQSDGKGSCYHSNGNIWLTINKSGGQCLDPEGTRVRRWTWYSLGFTPTPLRPIFMSINKCIGVRVLGKEQVFLSFLAKGQQAKFNVGAWCHKGNCKETKEVISASRPTLLKDELIALAARLKMHLLIQHVHQHMTPSHTKLPNATLAPRLHHLAQNLLKVGKKVKMSEDDVEFLHGCLQDCL